MADNVLSPKVGHITDVSPADIIAEVDQQGIDGTQVLLPNIIGIVNHNTELRQLPNTGDIASDCGVMIADITKRLNDATAACAVECADTVDTCCACIRARSQVTAEYVAGILDKCQGKIEKAVSSAYSATVGSVAQLGCQYPPAEVVQAIAAGVKPSDAFKGTVVFPPVPKPPPPVSPPPPPPPGPTCDTYCSCPAGYQGNFDANGCCTGCGLIPPPPITCPPGSSPDPLTGKLCVPNPPGPPPPPPPGGGTGGGTGDGGGTTATGCPPGGCVPPSGTYWHQQPDGSQIAMYDVPVYDSTGCLYACKPITYACNVSAIPHPPPGGGHGLGNIGTGFHGPPHGPPATQGKPICKLICDDITKCPPPDTCPSGWTLDRVTGVCVANKTGCDTANGWAIDPTTGGCVKNGIIDCGLGTNYTGPTTDGFDGYYAVCPNGQTILNPKSEPQCLRRKSDNSRVAVLTLYQGTTQWIITPPDSPDNYYIDLTASGKDCPDTTTPPPPPPPPPPSQDFGDCNLSNVVDDYKYWSGPASDPTIYPPIGDSLKLDCAKWLLGFGWICDIINTATAKWAGWLDSLSKANSCGGPLFVGRMLFNAALKPFGGWFGLIPVAWLAKAEYRINYTCQYKLPSPGELNKLSVQQLVSDDEWKAGQAANGECIPWQQLLRDGSYVYPSFSDTSRLYRRCLITQDTFHQLSHFNGIRSDDYADLQLRLSEFIPPVALTAEWAIRQIRDDEYAAANGLDDNLIQWWQDQGKPAADAAGVDGGTARNLYRQSWQLPGLQTILDAYRRIGDDAEIPGLGRSAAPVTTEQLEQLLRSSGYPQVWADRIAYLQYQPVTIRHLRMLLTSGVIDEQEMSSRLQKLGYTPDDADLIARANAVSAQPAIAKLNGLPSQAEILRLYKDDALSRDDAFGLLSQIGIDATPANSMLQVADTMRDSIWRRKAISAIRKRFMIGDYGQQDATQELLAAGVDAEKVDRILSTWQTELRLKSKEATVGQLCEWHTRGYIDSDTYVSRLGNLGYSIGDATRIYGSCEQRYNEATAKKLQAALEKAQRAQQKAAAAAKPCRTRSKPYCTPKTMVTHTTATAPTAKGPPKTTHTDSTEVVTEQEDITITEKVTEKT